MYEYNVCEVSHYDQDLRVVEIGVNTGGDFHRRGGGGPVKSRRPNIPDQRDKW